MKPVRRLMLRAIVLALLLLSLSTNVAVADDGWLTAETTSGNGAQCLLPEDPGFDPQ
jgi:hypothetical protein